MTLRTKHHGAYAVCQVELMYLLPEESCFFGITVAKVFYDAMAFLCYHDRILLIIVLFVLQP
jgi:hypothetical protein